ncbi:hypothetical protein GN244_ATG12057 [Phytophthora infestans]|uniref:Uncharacterized protein n=1 Tax=Phytophthora infestans TaxID=4787 RepID=A0A833VZV2_PHYIN|nr:hypothetical protein GN244_ATG12057 [Phytophthora infestans]
MYVSTGDMVHLRHPGLHWKVRCMLDSDDENTPPNVMQGRASPETKEVPDSQSTESDLASSGSATPPWLSPGFTDRVPKDKSNLPSSQDLSAATRSPHVRRHLRLAMGVVNPLKCIWPICSA